MCVASCMPRAISAQTIRAILFASATRDQYRRSEAHLLAMKDWQEINPALFNKQPDCLPGCDNYPFTSEASTGSLPLAPASPRSPRIA